LRHMNISTKSTDIRPNALKKRLCRWVGHSGAEAPDIGL
jgi:hypothetical protein